MSRRLRAALAFAALALACAPSATSAPAPIEHPSWAGYVAGSPIDGPPLRFTGVYGRWVEPTVSCNLGGSSAAFWVGLGGFAPGSEALEQIGTSVRCDGRGRPQHRAWFEFWPHPSYQLNARVRPGDSIAATVQAIGTTVRLRMHNLSRHWTVTRIISSLIPDLSTAEWIVEAPQTCRGHTCGRTTLASFGSVLFSDVSLSTPTTTGGLTNEAWTVSEILLVPRDELPAAINEGPGDAGFAPHAPTSPPATTGGPGATPEIAAADGHSFAVTWLPKT